jgi:RNA polymerase sigma-70 factor (ECF subfamily)
VQRRPGASVGTLSPAELAEAIADGDADAERDLVVKYSEGLLYILQRETRDSLTAEDLCQETFRIVIERLRKRRLATPEKLASFIIGVGRKLLLAHRRAWSRLPLRSGVLGEVADAAPTPLDQTVHLEELRLLRRAIESLEVARDRELLTRCYLLDQDKDEVCEAVGLDRKQLNKAISRARSRLRKLLLDTDRLRAK